MSYNTQETKQLWKTRQLTRENVLHWIEINQGLTFVPLTENQKISLSYSLYRIYDSYWRESGNLGGFMEAVLSNNLKEAVFKSDITNRRALALFPFFLNNLPEDWKERMGY